MSNGETLGVWEFPAEASYDLVGTIAQERIEEPDARGVLVSNRGDVITLQLVGGQLSGDPSSKLYVERRGGYEIARREAWPPVAPGKCQRVMLTLRAWPMRA